VADLQLTSKADDRVVCYSYTEYQDIQVGITLDYKYTILLLRLIQESRRLDRFEAHIAECHSCNLPREVHRIQLCSEGRKFAKKVEDLDIRVEVPSKYKYAARLLRRSSHRKAFPTPTSAPGS
jgi:hypothetical protein